MTARGPDILTTSSQLLYSHNTMSPLTTETSRPNRKTPLRDYQGILQRQGNSVSDILETPSRDHNSISFKVCNYQCSFYT
uniref:Ovule protein n=1 Tax=Steinernema glaseri TaxID=37863 RepID=A0A1I7Z3N2_9BILA